jgi:hypothetical protein
MSRKQRGYDSQRIVADYLQANGWEYALSAGAGRQGSDITGVTGIDWEVKARRSVSLLAVLKQLKERKQNGMGIGVLRLDGQGEKSIDEWCAVLRLEDLVYLLKASGYGQCRTM